MTSLISTVESARAEESRAKAERVRAEKALREFLRNLIRNKGLDFGIVSRRMGVPASTLTNYFCNGQPMREGNMGKLMDAIRRRPTKGELVSRKRPPCWKRNA